MMPEEDINDSILSQDIEDSIICPECGHEQEIHVIPSVNVTTDPDMKEKVLSGEIFLFTCEKCGFSGFAGFPFIYEDKETNGGFLIYLEPDCEDRVVGIDGDIADQVLLQNITMRLVTTINELKEKIFIFESGLDKICDEIWTITADLETRISRLMARDNISREAVIERINSQISDEERIAKSNLVIYNNTIPELQEQINAIAKERF